MQTYNKSIVAATVMNASINSAAYNVQQLFGAAIQAIYTGTPTGTFKLQASCDPATSYNAPGGAPTNWTDIANTSYAVTAAGNYMWNVTDIMYTYIRLVYTDTSGGASTAVLNATINAKGP